MVTVYAVADKKSGKTMTMEDLIDGCGGFGKYQILLIIGIYLHKLTCGWSILQMSFVGYIPNWYCEAGPSTRNTSHFSNHTFKTCSLYNNDTRSTQSCQGYYFEPTARTAVSEWDLVCDQKWIKAAITSFQMAGVLVGSILSGQLADLFGRKKTTFCFSLLHSLLNFGAAFSTSWEMFAGFRFIIGVGIGAILVVTFPYPMEFMPTKWRPILAVIPIWIAGVSIFSVAALVLNDWVYLHIACGAVGLPAMLGYFHVPESVRWLTLKGRFDEAEKVFEKMAAVNGKALPKQIRDVLEKVYQDEMVTRSKGRDYTYKDLFKGKRQIKISFIFGYMWFSLSAAYYGLSFGVSSLAGNLYLNIFLLSVVELPCLLGSFYFNNRIGRKWTIISFLFIGAVPACGCLIVQLAVSPGSRGAWITGLCLAAKMGLGVAWENTQTWISEHHPTVIRSLSFGLVNTTARVGGILAPFIIDLDDQPVIAYAIIAFILVGDIVLSFLVSDTKGRMLSDSIKSKTLLIQQNGKDNEEEDEKDEKENDDDEDNDDGVDDDDDVDDLEIPEVAKVNNSASCFVYLRTESVI